MNKGRRLTVDPCLITLDLIRAMPKNRVSKFYDFPYLLLILAVFFWSVNFIVGRAVRLDVPPVGLAFWRWSGASLLIFFPALRHLKHDWKQARKNLPILLLLSATGIAVFNTLVYMGLQQTIVINAVLMQSMMPVLIVAMSFLFFREKICRLQALGIALSLSGALSIILKGDPSLLGSLSINRGDLLIFIAVICYAAYSVMLRRRPAIHPLSLVAITFVIGSAMLLPFYLWESFAVRPMNWDAMTAGAVCYVAIFPSIISYICFNRGVELAGANRAGLFLHLMPVFGSIMAIAFLGESLRWYHGTGIGLIALGIVLATRK
jgi:drug/metabolite transporter (DMT)-like permease